jgi:hypothetical protein
MFGLKRYTLAGLLFIGARILAPDAAFAESSVDASIVQIEQVDERVSNVGHLVENVLKYISDQEGLNVKHADSMIQSATQDAFHPQTFTADIQDSMQKFGYRTIDSHRLARIADDLKASRKRLNEMYRLKDDTEIRDMAAQTLQKADSPRIQQLVDLMASPALAVETAVTAQAMYLAVHAFFNSDRSQLAVLSPEQLQAMPAQILSYLRQKNENEKPYSKDAERANEKQLTAVALASLSDEDLVFLLDFYKSPEGEAKRISLVNSYRQASADANQKMLQEYFSKLADYFKKNNEKPEN